MGLISHFSDSIDIIALQWLGINEMGLSAPWYYYLDIMTFQTDEINYRD